ncbi:Heme-binding protein A [subsurface metagenome]
MMGQLLESWDVSHEKLTWHIRPGVYWAPNEEQSAWMEARELTADDVIADLLCLREAPGGKSFKKFSGEIYATDRYTLVIEFDYFDSEWFYIIGYEDRAFISPPEMITAGASEWENQVGTGPFIFKEYVEGSYMSFSRNPNWWKTTTINGVEYPLPFIDELVIPIVPDESTRIAVLRTGTVDAYASVLPPYWSTLEQTAPGLLSASHLGEGRTLAFRCNQPPFNDIDLRRALMVGTDLKGFGDLQGAGRLPIHFYPTSEVNPTIYTPLEELPAETRLLFDYNPTLAMAMLADAGYAGGLELTCNIGTSAEHQDIGALLKDQWDKIGVTVNLNTVEQAAFDAMGRAVTYDDTIVGKFDIANPYFGLYKRARSRPLGIFNQADWSNERFDELMDVVAASTEPADQSVAYKEAAVILINEVPYIPLTLCPRRHYWWPWVKNYYGEWNVQDNPSPYPFAFAWIDQNLKEEMGY